jgi:dolichyl-diphosphooligosaccharide--protein glycosyltransferase
MVRLMLTLTPIVCVSAAIAFTSLLETYMKGDTPVPVESPTPSRKDSKKEKKGTAISTTGTHNYQLLVVAPILACLCLFAWHCTYVTSTSYSSPSVVLASQNRDGSQHIIDDFREAYYWLRQNVLNF